MFSTTLKKVFRRTCYSYETFQRFDSTFASKLVISEYGDPLKVVTMENNEIPEPEDREVLLKMLAAPVNPVDIDIIQGKYPIKFALPSVLGYQGVAKVIKLGQGVETLKEGDHVIPLKTNTGTWRTHLTLPEQSLLKIPKNLGLAEAATMIVNACTIYTMLKEFVDIQKDDTVIQNGGNSACGQLMIQMCKLWGINSVSVVRDRPDIQELKTFLINLGADYVLTEEQIRKTDIFKTGRIQKPKLALNCIGGRSATEISRHLQGSGCLVTYGGMSLEPVPVLTSSLIFNDICLRGFNIRQWAENKKNNSKREKMLDELITLLSEGKLKAPACTIIDFNNYKEALLTNVSGKKREGAEKMYS